MKANLKIMLALATALTLAAFLGCSGGGGGGATTTGTEFVPGTPSTTSTARGFLWKPISESDGNLVVLFPAAYRGRVTRGTVYAVLPPSEENVVEEGYFAGDTHNGMRPHYRFTRPGAAFGNDIFVVARLSDGSFESWYIPYGADRTEM